MAGGAEDGHRARDGPGARGRRRRVDVGAAQQVQHVRQLSGVLAEPLLGVLDGRVAVAQRPQGVLRPARQLDGRREEGGVDGLDVRARLRRPADLGRRQVRGVALQQVVVHLHDDPRAAVERDAVALARDGLAATGGPGAQPGGVVDVVELALETHAAEAGPAGLGRLRVLGLGLGDAVLLDPEQDHVVHDVGVAGKDLGAGEPGVLGEVRVEQEAAVVVGALPGRRGRRVRRGHRQVGAVLALAELALLDRAGGDGRGVVVREHDLLGVRRVLGRRGPPLRVFGAAPGDHAEPDTGQPDDSRQADPQLGAALLDAAHPGGQLIERPASTCRWVWKTLCPAPAPVLNTSR